MNTDIGLFDEVVHDSGGVAAGDAPDDYAAACVAADFAVFAL